MIFGKVQVQFRICARSITSSSGSGSCKKFLIFAYLDPNTAENTASIQQNCLQ
jgi:hypothetical protein